MLREQLQLKVDFISKPSTFESEIHLSHKTSFCTLCISLCELAADRRMCSQDECLCTRSQESLLLTSHLSYLSYLSSFPKNESGKGDILYQRNSFVQMSKLHNVRGRIYYISSDKKQENLYAVYEPQIEDFGRNLPSATRQNLRKAVQMGNVSKQEN